MLSHAFCKDTLISSVQCSSSMLFYTPQESVSKCHSNVLIQLQSCISFAFTGLDVMDVVMLVRRFSRGPSLKWLIRKYSLLRLVEPKVATQA